MSGKIQMSKIIPADYVTEGYVKGYYENAGYHGDQNDEIYRPTGPDVTYQVKEHF